MPRPLLFALFAALLVAFACDRLSADTIRLANGDTISGKVLAVTSDEVQIESETFGKITLPRKKVLAIVFGDAKPPAGKNDDAREIPDAKIDPKATPEELIEKLVPKDFDATTVRELSKDAQPVPNPDDVIRQLRERGVDPNLRRELQMRLPGFATPAVQAYFDEKVNGLISGEIDLNDIRKDAVDVRDQLEELKKDLGPSGEALNGYLSILNGFLKETAPADEKGKQPPGFSRSPPPRKPAPNKR